jgi:hypothetical protein
MGPVRHGDGHHDVPVPGAWANAFWSALKTAATSPMTVVLIRPTSGVRPAATNVCRTTQWEASAAPAAGREHHETTCLGFHRNYRLSGEYSLIETLIRSERAH